VPGTGVGLSRKIGEHKMRSAKTMMALVLPGMLAGPLADAREPIAESSTQRTSSGVGYRVLGDGPPVLLIHGGAMDSGMWDAQVTEFSKRYRVITYDQRGMGETPAPGAAYFPADDAVDVLDALGIARAHVVGQSMGGRIAIDLALAHSDRVLGLVLVESGLSGYPFSAEGMRAMGKMQEAAMTGGFSAAVDVLLERPGFVSTREHPEARDIIRAQLERNLPRMGTMMSMRYHHPQAIDELDKLTMPVLVLRSDHTGEDTEATTKLIVERVPRAQLVPIENAGHMMNIEQPDAFNKAVLSFLSSIDTP
jgi:pimeloyl-ACP methyl ester carboxylesterase